MEYNLIIKCLENEHLPLVNVAFPITHNLSNIKWDTVIEKAKTLSVTKNSKNTIQDITIQTPYYKEIYKNIPIINIMSLQCDTCGKLYRVNIPSNL